MIWWEANPSQVNTAHMMHMHNDFSLDFHEASANSSCRVHFIIKMHYDHRTESLTWLFSTFKWATPSKVTDYATVQFLLCMLRTHKWQLHNQELECSMCRMKMTKSHHPRLWWLMTISLQNSTPNPETSCRVHRKKSS
jgi:hypothetical protein